MVETLGSGAEAVLRAKAGGLDLILLDVMMPVMDGRTTFAPLRALGMERRFGRLCHGPHTGA